MFEATRAYLSDLAIRFRERRRIDGATGVPYSIPVDDVAAPLSGRSISDFPLLPVPTSNSLHERIIGGRVYMIYETVDRDGAAVKNVLIGAVFPHDSSDDGGWEFWSRDSDHGRAGSKMEAIRTMQDAIEQRSFLIAQWDRGFCYRINNPKGAIYAKTLGEIPALRANSRVGVTEFNKYGGTFPLWPAIQ